MFGDMKFTKKNLRNGDVVKCRNGQIAIAIPDTNVLIFKDGYLSLSSIRDDLTHTGFTGADFDIVAVRRPMSERECSFVWPKNEYFGPIVYERNEPIEMTLEEVCKALGKEIKIVKK